MQMKNNYFFFLFLLLLVLVKKLHAEQQTADKGANKKIKQVLDYIAGLSNQSN